MAGRSVGNGEIALEPTFSTSSGVGFRFFRLPPSRGLTSASPALFDADLLSERLACTPQMIAKKSTPPADAVCRSGLVSLGGMRKKRPS
jgi:hypothetical protein